MTNSSTADTANKNRTIEATDSIGAKVTSQNPQTKSRYIIGIDLGTTNCALSYFDTLSPEDGIKKFNVLQWESETQTVESETLPSFCYLPPKNEVKKGRFNLPFSSFPHSKVNKSSEENKNSEISATDQTKVENKDFALGKLAANLASSNEGRVIHSAKSWLCHGSVNRLEKILPWNSDEVIGSKRKSPVEVSSYFLEHLRLAWNSEFARHETSYALENQRVTVTVPASFDEAAQRLTLKAIDLAGYNSKQTNLLEEPQAAFYHWLFDTKKQGIKIESLIPGLDTEDKKILVCDIGGGTSDFSLFSLSSKTATSELDIKRIRVSDHILLGGDNIDLKLAYVLEARLLRVQGISPDDPSIPSQLTSKQWAQLVSQTRNLKEQILSGSSSEGSSDSDKSEDDEFSVSVAGAGSGFFGSVLSATIKRADLTSIILDGFYPICKSDSKLKKPTSALQEWNLPYAADSRITSHLANFISGIKIDAVIYTGGSLKPQFIQNRITDLIESWQNTKIEVLHNSEMDLAVSLGATSFGLATAEQKNQVKGGYPRSLFIEANKSDGQKTLICILPKGTDTDNQKIKIDQIGLQVRIGEPVQFQLFSSNTRDHDNIADLVEYRQEDFFALPPMQTRLTPSTGTNTKGKKSKGDGKLVDVGISVDLRNTGLLEISCFEKNVATDSAIDSTAERETQTWNLEFNLQDNQQTKSRVNETENVKEKGNESELETSAKNRVSKTHYVRATETISTFYGKKKASSEIQKSPSQLMKILESSLELERKDWDLNLLRELWPDVNNSKNRRGRTATHEMSWLSLSGYLLRPGYGISLDEYRVNDLWEVYSQGMMHPKEARVKNQWWIMWRRIAGGLKKNQQDLLFSKIIPILRKGTDATAEMYMLAGSLELVDMDKKVQFGSSLVEQIVSGKKSCIDQKIWALSRLASRVPLYGGPECTIRPSFIEKWSDQLQILNCQKLPYKRLGQYYSQAGRVVNDREFDISDKYRAGFLAKLEESSATEGQSDVVREFIPLDIDSKSQLFGESLPAGFLLS